jgi:transposase
MQTVSSLSRDEMERRRLAAARELIGGRSQASVAREFGVSRTTASRWQKALNGKGLENLRKRRATGRPSRLTPLQCAEVVEMFAAGPRAMGIDSDRWTTVRLADAIVRRFGVRYDPDHVGRLMHRLGLRKRERHEIQPLPPPYVGVYPPHAAYGFTDIPTTVQ